MGGVLSNNRVSRNIYQLEPLTPLPTEEELSRLGGRYFVRPSDGRKLEYFVRNEGQPTAILNVVCTVCTAQLYHVWRTEKILPLLEKHQVTFINVSTAGVGPSEPYGDSLGALDAMEYVNRTAKDLTALLKFLGVQKVYTMGVSGGWTPSSVLAVSLAESNEVELKGVCCISGIPWQTKTENFWEKSMGKGCTFALSTRFLESRAMPYIMNSFFPMNEEKTIQGLTTEEQEGLGPELCSAVVQNMNRSSAHYLFVAAFLGRLTTSSKRSKLPEMHADLKKLGTNIKVHLHMSTQDKLVPTARVVPSIQKMVPHAQLYSNTLSHMLPPMETAIANLLDQDES